MKHWLEKCNVDVNFHSASADDHATISLRLCAYVKKDDGNPLTPSSLVGIRAPLNRYLLAAPFYRNLNIVSGEDFVIAVSQLRSVIPQVVLGESSDRAAETSVVSSSNGGMIAKYSKLFGSCTFQNSEIKFN